MLVALRTYGITALDIGNPDARDTAVSATIEASLRRLTRDERDRYEELAVFGEDVAVPGEVVARLWAYAGGWSTFKTRRLCQRLSDLALLAAYRRGPDCLVLHDMIRGYLWEKAGASRANLHAAVVDAHRIVLPRSGQWADLPAEYAYMWVVAAHAPVRSRFDVRSWSPCWPTRDGWSASLNGAGPLALKLTYSSGDNQGSSIGGCSKTGRTPPQPSRSARLSSRHIRLATA